MTTGYDLDPTAPATVALQAEYERLSAQAARLPGARLDIAYGQHPRQRLDVFSAGSDALALVFFHGGYWRAGSKDARRFPAKPWNSHGVSWVAVNYRLTPEYALADAVDDACAAVKWLTANARDLGLDPGQFHLSGNSAGGHLAAMAAADHPGIRSLCAISGLFDLEPLLSTSANDWLRLDAEAAHRLSPIHQLPAPGLPILIGCGGAETPAFKSQSRHYAQACRAAGNPVTEFESPGADHFRIIGEYGIPGTLLFDRLARLVTSA